tara:strand:+ start:570 stop:776 length:207 start_codon:yes stop_codon:yes gene_type:complete
MKKLVNGILTDMTAEEISARQAEETEEAVRKQEKQNAKVAKETKKASGKQKLKDLGLDDEEIKALMGA